MTLAIPQVSRLILINKRRAYPLNSQFYIYAILFDDGQPGVCHGMTNF